MRRVLTLVVEDGMTESGNLGNLTDSGYFVSVFLGAYGTQWEMFPGALVRLVGDGDPAQDAIYRRVD